jgi:hypothetical protein
MNIDGRLMLLRIEGRCLSGWIDALIDGDTYSRYGFNVAGAQIRHLRLTGEVLAVDKIPMPAALPSVCRRRA